MGIGKKCIIGGLVYSSGYDKENCKGLCNGEERSEIGEWKELDDGSFM